MGINYH